jgi:hypothetical protein
MNFYDYLQTLIKDVPNTTPFDGRKQPDLKTYLSGINELFHYFSANKTIYVYVNYILFQIYKKIPITPKNIYRLLIATSLLSLKIYREHGVLNKTFADVIGLSITDINELEISILKLIDYDVIPFDKIED